MVGEKNNLISIVVATFNAEKMLQSCIDSIIAQTFINFELIIVDGGSIDGTVAILQANHKHIRYWISEPDNGIYDAWNKALKHVSGSWVCFLGADDTFLPDALQHYVDFLNMHQHEEFDYVSSRINLVKDSKLIRTVGKPWRWKEFRRYMNVAHVGSLQNKRLYESYGLYDVSYKICADYELLLRPKENLKAGFINAVTVNMTVGGASDSIPALHETERAKVTSGGRYPLMARVEKRLAILRMNIRKWIWY